MSDNPALLGAPLWLGFLLGGPCFTWRLDQATRLKCTYSNEIPPVATSATLTYDWHTITPLQYNAAQLLHNSKHFHHTYHSIHFSPECICHRHLVYAVHTSKLLTVHASHTVHVSANGVFLRKISFGRRRSFNSHQPRLIIGIILSSYLRAKPHQGHICRHQTIIVVSRNRPDCPNVLSVRSSS